MGASHIRKSLDHVVQENESCWALCSAEKAIVWMSSSFCLFFGYADQIKFNLTVPHVSCMKFPNLAGPALTL